MKMLPHSLLSGLFLAVTIRASPAKLDDQDHHGELVRVKRDTLLEPRDFELAEMHQVNLTEMYKHSVIKRDDGDDITVWVASSFEEVQESEEGTLSKRQSARLWGGSHYVSNGNNDFCFDHDRRDITSSSSPFTGGIHAMVRWCENNPGFFRMGEGYGGTGWRTILIGGSNSGRNARYRMRITGNGSGPWTRVGTADVRNDCDWTRSHERRLDGHWRAASYGWESCDGTGGSVSYRINYEVVSFPGEEV